MARETIYACPNCGSVEFEVPVWKEATQYGSLLSNSNSTLWFDEEDWDVGDETVPTGGAGYKGATYTCRGCGQGCLFSSLESHAVCERCDDREDFTAVERDSGRFLCDTCAEQEGEAADDDEDDESPIKVGFKWEHVPTGHRYECTAIDGSLMMSATGLNDGVRGQTYTNAHTVKEAEGYLAGGVWRALDEGEAVEEVDFTQLTVEPVKVGQIVQHTTSGNKYRVHEVDHSRKTFKLWAFKTDELIDSNYSFRQAEKFLSEGRWEIVGDSLTLDACDVCGTSKDIETYDGELLCEKCAIATGVIEGVEL